MSTKEHDLLHLVALELKGIRESLAGPLAQWSNGARVEGARPLQLSRAAVSPNLWNGGGRLLGWSLRVPADAAGPATVTFRDGDGGDLVGLAAIAVGATVTHYLGAGISVGQALYAEVTGPVVGVAYFRD